MVGARSRDPPSAQIKITPRSRSLPLAALRAPRLRVRSERDEASDGNLGTRGLVSRRRAVPPPRCNRAGRRDKLLPRYLQNCRSKTRSVGARSLEIRHNATGGARRWSHRKAPAPLLAAALQEDCPRSVMLLLETEQESPAPAAIERAVGGLRLLGPRRWRDRFAQSPVVRGSSMSGPCSTASGRTHALRGIRQSSRRSPSSGPPTRHGVTDALHVRKFLSRQRCLGSVQSSGPWAGVPCWCSESCRHGSC